MEQLILIAHLLIALTIIGLIMLQQGKGAELGASFGAGASQTLFGSEGNANVLTRLTAVLATAFFVTSFSLALVAKNKADTVAQADIPIPVDEIIEMSTDIEVPTGDAGDLPLQVPSTDDIPAAEPGA